MTNDTTVRTKDLELLTPEEQGLWASLPQVAREVGEDAALTLEHVLVDRILERREVAA
jgi:hypothetical protein